MNNGHSPPKTADIAILGAGVMGASIAFHLASASRGASSSWTRIMRGMGQCLPRTRASNFRLEHEHIRGVSTDPG